MADYPHQATAICGIGCRFPGGVTDSKSFWQLLTEGRDGVTPVPADRWNAARFHDPEGKAPGKMYVNAGGFLQQRLDMFDAGFFGISPREASRLDPQQRLLLEVAWEALEDAGIPHDSLAGSSTGVFVGGFMSDNLLTQLNPLNRDLIGPHSEVGATLGILSNRLSHFFDLQGPSLTVDTACSSSLTAFHLACRALQAGECDLALVGGVSVMTRPETPIAMCKGGFLARDGRSKSFDARGDGYGRGEGAGVVVLRRVADAVASGDPIIALVRGTGANQDGRTDGITVPNADAQEALVRRVYAGAEVAPAQIGYIEAHGTGTAVGDPIEARALGQAIGAHRAAGAPAIVGSLKSNIGHLEAAAGIAGIIKAALALREGVVPVLANLQTPNPTIPFDALGLRLPLENIAMTEPKGERFYAVNSFGYGGSNAHALLQDWAGAEAAPEAVPDEPSFRLLPLSARSDEALRQTALRHGDLLGAGAADLDDICHSAACRRPHLDHRLAVTGASAAEIASRLTAWAETGEAEGVSVGRGRPQAEDPVFVFTGMGPQWWGMGRALYDSEPVFRAAADRCDLAFQRCSGWSILGEMRRDEADSRMERTEIAQPANFLLQVALTELWRSWGVVPSAVVGHSVGEVTSAYVSGALTLEEAAEVSFHRSQLQKRAAGAGGMLALGATEAQAQALAAPYAGLVSLAASNSPNAAVLAGDMAALEKIAAEANGQDLFNRFLKVEVPYHSPAMDPLETDLLAALAHHDPRALSIPVWSTVTGKRADEGAFDGPYFFRNIREPVRFAAAIADLIAAGHRSFLEVGPHPVLSGAIRECAAEAGAEVALVPSLHRKRPELETARGALAALYTGGGRIRWGEAALWRGTFCALPHYPWQRELHWEESAAARQDRLGGEGHPLLGDPLPSAAPVWEREIGGARMACLQDHVVDGLALLPGAAYVEVGLALLARLSGRKAGRLTDLDFGQALVLDQAAWPVLQASWDPETRRAAIHSRADAGADWMRHARMTLDSLPLAEPPRCDLGALRASLDCAMSGERHYRRMSDRGLDYGPAFQGVRRLWLDAGAANVLAEIEAPEGIAGGLCDYALHPAILDACFQTLLETIADPADRDVYVPVRIESLQFYRPPGRKLFVQAERRPSADRALCGDLRIIDETGALCARFEGIVAQALTDRRAQDRERADDRLFGLKWVERPPEAARIVGRQLVLCRQTDAVLARAEALAAQIDTADLVAAHDVTGAIAMLDDAFGPEAAPSRYGSVVLLWETKEADDPVGLELASDFLDLVQHAARLQARHSFGLDLVTVSAQAPGEDLPADAALRQAAVTGLARVAIAENPALRLRVLDIDTAEETLVALAREVQSLVHDDDVALRGTRRFARRLTTLSYDTLAELPRRALSEDTEAALPAGEAEIALIEAVQPAGEDPVHALAEIRALGAGCAGLAVGDRLALRLPSARERQRVPAEALGADRAVVPGPLAQVTPLLADAWHVVRAVARLEPEDRVLLLATADARGCAVAQMARAHCARLVVATPDAGSVAIFSGLGIDAFACETAEALDSGRARLGGTEADVLIGLGQGSALALFQRLLAPQGRMVIWQDGDTAARPPVGLGPNQSLLPVNMTRLRKAAPERIASAGPALRSFVEHHPDLHIPMEARALEVAEPAPVATRTLRFDPAKSYLVSGGLGGFGLETAKWLVSLGARHLVLAGRSKTHSDEVLEEIALLRTQAGSVEIASVDVTDAAAVAELVAGIEAGPAPLGGVFHAAAVLDDGPMDTLRRSQLRTAMLPKALGAWNLHLATRDLPLDHFVMFSSISSLVGSPGQGSYVAANGVLDALAAHRAARGLAGSAICWGAISEVGMAARRKEISDYLTGVGFGLMKPQEALAGLAPVLAQGTALVAIAKMDWPTLASFYPGWRASQRNAEIVAAVDEAQAAGGGGRMSEEELAELPDRLTGIVGGVLGIPEDRIDRQSSLVALGLDSILAIEIQSRIETGIGVKLSVLDLLRGVSIADLCKRLEETLRAAEAPPRAVPGAVPEPEPDENADIDAYLSGLSDAELAALVGTPAQAEEERV
ncbi:SDR family NAD(P)-dependent oxidoreductase [Salipiger sp. P9]|uniref:type I polyketide synthase n=1 Tax=Salipiger pentaromativorans TaxID=2943193 RepID=UPI00215844ED|nr:type I polyketide synthase [Salipiger pentaromativorans]MCR8547597.1 SDR family NAD(P)-dependent oxidoreductase [Salipiger pentaromativorans]